MTDTAGRTEAIKKRLMTLIANSSTVLSSSNVTGDSDSIDSYLMDDKLPFVVVEFNPTMQQDTYGRRVASTQAGRFIEQPFTIMVFHSACSETGESSKRYVHQVADEILDYLDGRRASEKSNKIEDIYGLSMRDADVAGAGDALVRVIINGRLLVLRED